MRAAATITLTLALVVVVAGCGSRRGDGGPADVGGGGSGASSGSVVATLGDSITAGSPRWDPDPDVRDGFLSPDRDSQWQRWVDADHRFRNCGVWGERTDEIARRFATCTEGASAVVVQGGINDIVQGRSVADAAGDLACMVDDARRAGLDAALVEVLPWNNGDGDAAEQIRALNERIHAIADDADIPVLPFHDVLHDSGDTDRMPDDRTVEGDHPNVAGYRELGEGAWREPRPVAAAVAERCSR